MSLKIEDQLGAASAKRIVSDYLDGYDVRVLAERARCGHLVMIGMLRRFGVFREGAHGRKHGYA